jgi:hypothetical protein
LNIISILPVIKVDATSVFVNSGWLGRRAQKAATNKIMCGEFEHCYKGKLLFIAGREDRGCL